MMKRAVAAVLCAGMVLTCGTPAFAYVGSNFASDAILAAAPYQDESPQISYLSFNSYSNYDMQTSSTAPSTGSRFRLQAVYRLTAGTPTGGALNVRFDPTTGNVTTTGNPKQLYFQKAAALTKDQVNFSFRQGVSNSLTLGTPVISLRDNRKYIAVDPDDPSIIYVYRTDSRKVIIVKDDVVTNSTDSLESLFTDYYVTMTLPITLKRTGDNERYTPDLQAKMSASPRDYRTVTPDYISIFTYTDAPDISVECIATGKGNSPSSGTSADGTAKTFEEAAVLFQDGANSVAVYPTKPTATATDIRKLRQAMDSYDTLVVSYDNTTLVFTGRQIRKLGSGDSLNFRTSDRSVRAIERELEKKGIDSEYLSFYGDNPSVQAEIHTYTGMYDQAFVYAISGDESSIKYLKTAYTDDDGSLVFTGNLGDYLFTDQKLTSSQLRAVNNALGGGSNDSTGSSKPSTSKPSNGSSSSGSSSSSSSAMANKISATAKEAAKKKKDSVNLVYSYTGGSVPSSAVKELQKAYSDSQVNVKLYLQVKDSAGKTQTQYLLQGKEVYNALAFKPNMTSKKQGNGDIQIKIGTDGKSMGTLTYIASKFSKTGLKTDKLTLLKLDSKTGKYSKVPRKCTVDDSGYFHFSVLNGGTYVITDSPNSYLKK